MAHVLPKPSAAPVPLGEVDSALPAASAALQPPFTPGPWAIDGISLVHGPDLTRGGQRVTVCKTVHNAEANARLIAAAPELYEEAEFLCARLRELECDILDDEVGRQYYGHCSPARARLEAALAKARRQA